MKNNYFPVLACGIILSGVFLTGLPKHATATQPTTTILNPETSCSSLTIGGQGDNKEKQKKENGTKTKDNADVKAPKKKDKGKSKDRTTSFQNNDGKKK